MGGSRLARLNVQDNSTYHTDSHPLTIGRNCTVGHNVILRLYARGRVGRDEVDRHEWREDRPRQCHQHRFISPRARSFQSIPVIGSPARVIRRFR
jgi:hypothetical protein